MNEFNWKEKYLWPDTTAVFLTEKYASTVAKVTQLKLGNILEHMSEISGRKEIRFRVKKIGNRELSGLLTTLWFYISDKNSQNLVV